MSEPYLGQITMYGFNFAIRGWAMCNGQLLPISQNSALFSLLGTIYGGDGRTTFALPNMQSRVPVHFGRGPGLSLYRIGDRGGAETTTLTNVNLPSHTHSAATKVKAVTGGSATEDPTNNYLSEGGSYNNAADRGATFVDMNAGSAETTIGSTGGGQSFNELQPYLAVNFQIALQGLFPSRS